MYTKRFYSPKEMLSWTRLELIAFLVIATVPVIVYEVFEQHWLHVPWLPIALVGTVVGFLLGFQNNAAYDRLWEARKIWGGIVNTSRAWGIVVKDFVSDQFVSEPVEGEELKTLQRELIQRHIAWMTALRHAMRQPRTWERFLAHKTNREWAKMIGIREHGRKLREELEESVTAAECTHLQDKSNVAAQLLGLQSKQLRELRRRGLIEDFRHMEMQRVLIELYALQGKSERIKNFPYPRQYATLNALFVWIFILLLPFGMLYEFDRIGQQVAETYPAFADNFVWLSVPFSMLVMWVFHTVERIGRVSENPFEGSPNDVPITAIARGIEIDLLEMFDTDKASIPDPIKPAYGALT